MDEEYECFGSRFRERFLEATSGIVNMSEWCRMHGYEPKRIYMYCSGASLPRLDMFDRLCRDLDVSADWLLGKVD